MHAHPLLTGLRALLAIAGVVTVLISLALEYSLYRMLLLFLITSILLLVIF